MFGFYQKVILDPFVVHEHDDWVFTLSHVACLPPDLVTCLPPDLVTCLPPDLVTTLAHYPSDVTEKSDFAPEMVP